MKPNVVGFVFARGGSKGIPFKNLRILDGMPLIARAVRAARRSEWIRTVIVSTDDPQIAAIARNHGAEVPFVRPAELCTDDAPEWLAWQHAVRFHRDSPRFAKMDVFVSVPATAPFREPEDIDRCVRRLLDEDLDAVVTVTQARRSPYFNMVTLDERQVARMTVNRQSVVVRRQECPEMYDITPVAYVARPEYVLGAKTLFEGRVGGVVIPEDRALDLDTEHDFAVAEALCARPEPSTYPKRDLRSVG